jgi:hypothetical protein
MKKLLFADFLLALVLLLGAEVGVRLLLPHDVSGRFSYGFDRDSGFVESGNGTVSLVRAGGRRFHPQTFSRQRPADTRRIMVIGDSVPRGSSLKTAYPYLLQEHLRSQGISAEVINLAIAGFGARRSQLVVRKVLEYDPSLVILHLNDSNEYEDEREYRRSQDFKGWHPRHWLMKAMSSRPRKFYGGCCRTRSACKMRPMMRTPKFWPHWTRPNRICGSSGCGRPRKRP